MLVFFFFKQKTAYEMRISDWSSDVCSSDLFAVVEHQLAGRGRACGRSGLRGGVDRGQARHRGQQRAGDEEGNELAVHGWGVSVGEGGCGAASPASAGAAAALSPPPLNMYLPTIWMMSTAGVVNAISSPGLDRKSTRLNSSH